MRKGALSNLISIALLASSIISSCGKLPKEQRKAFADEMKQRTVRQISEKEILEYVQNEVEGLDSVPLSLRPEKKSELFIYNRMEPEEIKEKKLRDLVSAYMYSAAEGGVGLEDANIQELEDGNYIVTYPVISDSAGIKKLDYLQTYTFSRKKIVQLISTTDE